MSVLSEYIDFALVSLPDYVLTIGGYCNDWPSDSRPTNIIMRYEIDQWSPIGKLLTRRQSHNAYFNGDRVFIIGGYDYNEIRSENDTSPNYTRGT